MRITKIEINHMTNPLGFNLDDHLHIVGYIDKTNLKQLDRNLIIKKGQQIVFQTGWGKAKNLVFDFPFVMEPRTRYDVSLKVKTKNKNIITNQAWFETGYLGQKLNGNWIGAKNSDLHSIILEKSFDVKKIKHARLYITGLGLYEAYLDGKKIGDEYLTPGFTDYKYYVQLNTYDVTKYLTPGNHKLQIMLADGWYKGKLGLKEHGGVANIYGDTLMAMADLRLINESNQGEVIATDESWNVTTAPVTHSGIYYGEDLDNNSYLENLGTAKLRKAVNLHLFDRLSLPIKTHEKFSVKKVIHTNRGKTVLDFGQNLAGWVEFKDPLNKGDKVSIKFGEIMQNDEFYTDNLRSARAEFTYVSDGQGKLIRPHFTYFGFRYIELVDFPSQINPKDFKAVALYSDMPETGDIKTNNKKVNRLFANVKWGQKSNFIDVPTDCPQRDERLGWTGDAAIFAKTASYNMDTFEFFRKFSFDIAVEQSENNGLVPLYVPSLGQKDGGKAVWSDAATIIPWVTYQRTGDKAVLQQNIGAMMSWVDWIHDRAEKHSNEYLWLGDDQLGDWLALDTEDIMKLKGKTPDDLIASAYYYYSSQIVAKAAKVLNMKHEMQYYRQLAQLIKVRFINRFFSGDGLPIANTQTGLAICLQFGLYPENSKKILIKHLVAEIEKNRNHLATGFVGTPLLLPVLSKNGQTDLALRLFLNEDYPSWLYEVNLGATTIWERWNSVEPDGTIAKNGMNSLNHYSAGSVMEWAYEYLLGIKQEGNNAVFSPIFNAKLHEVSGKLALPTGELRVSWQLIDSKKVKIFLSIPFGAKIQLALPAGKVFVDGKETGNIELDAGKYQLIYQSEKLIIDAKDIHTPLKEFIFDKHLCNEISKLIPFWDFLTVPDNIKNFKQYSLYQLSREMRGIGFKPFTQEQIKEINKIFREDAFKKKVK